MKKKKFFALILTLLMTLGFAINVSATTPNANNLTLKIIDKDLTEIYGGMREGRITVYKQALYNNDGTIHSYVYGMEPQKNNIDDTNEVSSIKPTSDYGYTYLMQNGFPNKSFGFGDNGDYYVTQLAVWMYAYKVYGYKADDKLIGYLIDTNGDKSYNFTGSYSADNRQTKIADAAYELYKKALNAHTTGKPNKTYKLSHSISTLDMSVVDGKIQSKPITVSLDNINEYNVAFNIKNVSAISTETGKEKTTFRVAEKFVVRYNGDIKDLNIKVTITAKDPNAVIYEVYPEGSNKQKMISAFLDSDGSNLSDEVNLRYQTNRTTISIQDTNTGRVLPGATLVLTDLHDRQVATWVTTTEPYYIVLSKGTYNIEETIPPKGYKRQTRVTQFTVNGDGTDKVSILSEPLLGFNISNRDTEGNELPGTTLLIRDSEKNEVATWETTEEPYHIVLSPGRYTLEETVAPLEYELNKNKISFTVNEDGSVSEPLIMYNELKAIPVPITGSIRSIAIVTLSLIIVVCGTLIFYDGYRKRQVNN